LNLIHLITPYPHGYSYAHAIYQDVNVQLNLNPMYYAY
jgi:hypothetical protein